MRAGAVKVCFLHRASVGERQHDVAHLPPRFDIPRRLDHLLQRVGPVDDRSVFPCLDELFKKDDIRLRVAMATVYTPPVSLFTVLAKKMRATLPEPDIAGVMAAVERLLDASIASEGYVIAGTDGTGREGGASSMVNLGQIDLVALMATFEQGQKHVAAQKLRGQLTDKIERLAQKNRTRADFMEKLQRLIDEYNAGSMNVETFFQQLVDLARALSVEEQRAVAEQLDEEELAIFDLLTRPAVSLTDAERDQVKRVARDLLTTLKQEELVLDWRKRQATQADVMITVRTALDTGLPQRVYTAQIYQEKCTEVYDHVFTAYADSHHSIYAA
jgi:type I restriction enzyme R subunit